MTEQMQQSFEDWRAAQTDGRPSLRQELAYKDGFADALKVMRADLATGRTAEVREAAAAMSEADQAERV